ncbi:hypothetical protein [Xanthomonas cannabis]|uniref:hypothetical protein n=1 Tax=Xanthomonas cannabis TaxID=1885674 RepID=UPI00339EF4C8
MTDVNNSAAEDLTDVLAYAGFVLVAFELVRSLIVRPVKNFYALTTFAPGMPFVSYEQDVLTRHKKEFEACLLYLRDLMQAIDSDDFHAIQELRRHRNDIAHELPSRLESLRVQDYAQLLKAADRVLFKLSNHSAYIEIGAYPIVKAMNIDWDTAEGHEHLLFRAVLGKVERLKGRLA